jgi:predicted nucleic acid-binding protein
LRVAIDTNVLVYAEGVNGPLRREAATSLLDRLASQELVVPVQVFGELFNVLAGRAGRSRAAARDAISGWRGSYEATDSTAAVVSTAIDLATDHGLAIWDAVIVSASSSARCALLLSEDMQDGFAWGGVTVANPFGENVHPLLRAALADGAGR